MEIRNGTYTLYNNTHMLVREYYGHGISDPDIDNMREISYAKKLGYIKGFTLDEKEGRYCKSIKIADMSNAYEVETRGRYKGQEFIIFGYRARSNVFGIMTRDEKLASRLGFISLSDGFILEVDAADVDEIWEVRGKSKLGLPLPQGLKEKVIIL
ncbi:hypothetical protein [Pseudoalteromonas sp. BDTF-M6]|uniref:hypothetical protein n=1 Tax=Pseudoalteromonas sp. BDTF-M6 TaxID=2796132 RepID=UPI001BAF45B1|nr:hypothetical protein [Pseudoalteromonas sp. BDTF-M6]MBS3796501.1 hypothetical protein [Pseudoalteromonas sp. BDTF-M6]